MNRDRHVAQGSELKERSQAGITIRDHPDHDLVGVEHRDCTAVVCPEQVRDVTEAVLDVAGVNLASHQVGDLHRLRSGR